MTTNKSPAEIIHDVRRRTALKTIADIERELYKDGLEHMMDRVRDTEAVERWRTFDHGVDDIDNDAARLIAAHYANEQGQ